LLEADADINATDEQGKTALYHAIESGDESIMELLLEHGADVTIASKTGVTPLMRATMLPVANKLKILLPYILQQENSESIINAQDRHKKTALDHALEYGKESAKQLLLQAGAGRTTQKVPPSPATSQ
jgi:uncharacterized protein